MTQSFNQILSEHQPPLLRVVLLTVGATPTLDAPLPGRQQRPGAWIDEFCACLQLLDDLIRVHWIDACVSVTVDHERPHRDRGFTRLMHESSGLLDNRRRRTGP